MTAGNSDGELRSIAVAVDELGNAITGGDPRWTISARCWANRHSSPVAMFMVKALNIVQPNHCQKAYEQMVKNDQKDIGEK